MKAYRVMDWVRFIEHRNGFLWIALHGEHMVPDGHHQHQVIMNYFIIRLYSIIQQPIVEVVGII